MAYENMGNLSDLNDGTRPASPIGEQLAMLQSELGKSYNSPEDEAGIRREISRLVSGDNAKPGAQLIGALGSPEANAALAEVPRRTAPDMGALSQVVPQQAPQSVAPQQTQGPQGALAQAMQNIANFKMPTVQDALNQYMPQDDSRGRYLALAAGLGSTTKTGGFGEQIGNVASAMQQQKMQQEQMRLQYLPHIMQQVAAQQQMAMQMQNRALIGSVLGGGTTGGVASPAAPQGAATAPQASAGGIPAVSGVPTIGGPLAQGQPQQTPQSQPQGSPAPSLPAPQPAAQVTPQAMQQVQAEWQRMGMTYPISQIEAVGILTSPDPTTAFMTLVQKHSEPSAGGMLSIQAGHMPGTPEYLADQQAALIKANNIPLQTLRAGSMFGTGKFKDGVQIMGFTPASPSPGHVYVFDPSTSVGYREVPIEGGGNAITAAAEAKGLGEAGAKPTVVFSGITPIQSTAKIQVQSAQGMPLPPGSPSAMAAVPVTPVLLPGVEAGAIGQQKEMVKNFNDLTNQAAQAQTTNSYLIDMRDRAKNAIVGPASDKLNLMNNLLAQAKLPTSNDMATNYQLMKKSENQIISRLSSGGLSTDQARAILKSAYPNTDMTTDAIDQATGNLIGSNDLTLAKNKILAPHANALSPVTYSQTETVFNKNADPTLFERYSKYKNLTPGSAAAQAYLSGVLKQDPTFLDRVKNLTKIGAF